MTHGGVQMRNSHLLLWAATLPVPHIPVSVMPACSALASTIYLIDTHTWKDQYYTSRQLDAIRQRLSNKSSYGSNKGFKSETSSTVWAASWGERRGAFYKHSLFSGVSLFRRQSSPNIEAKLWHKLPWWLQINDLYHSESTRLGETDMQNIFTINCSVVYTRTPCRS